MYTESVIPLSLAEAFERIRIETNYQKGQAGNAKGRLAEERVLSAAVAACEKENWLSAARLASRTEDANGIDVIVKSSVGELYLQVKSSHYGARCFRYKRPNAKVMVVIIDPAMSDKKIECKVYDALCRLRQHFMKIRRGKRRRKN